MTAKADAPAPVGTEEDDLDVALLEYVQTLSIEERLRRHAQMLTLVQALRAAGKELHGFDPSAVEQAGRGES